MILSQNGLQIHALGGSEAHAVLHKGDIAAVLDWMDIGGEDPEPCMILVKDSARVGGAGYVIPWQNAHLYADSVKGSPSRELLDAARSIAQELGFYPDRYVITRICDLIVDTLPLLIRMPSDSPNKLPKPKLPGGAIEATLTVNGRTFAEAEI